MCSSQVISHSYVTVEFCVCQAVMLKKERKIPASCSKGFPHIDKSECPKA